MRIISQGTKSVLCGCHSVVHCFFVIRAWKKLYKKYPAFWQVVCIFLHDIGHLGKNYLDDYALKEEHWKLGANIAYALFGKKGFDLCAGHTKHSGRPVTELFFADKYSWSIACKWWLVTNVLVEPELRHPGKTINESVEDFIAFAKNNAKSGEYSETHGYYLKVKKENTSNGK